MMEMFGVRLPPDGTRAWEDGEMGTKALAMRLLVIVPLLAGALALGGPAQAAAAYACTGNVRSTTITQNVVVPAGEECSVVDVVIKGNVTVGSGSVLYGNGIDIRGTLSGTGVDSVDLTFATVRGGVTVVGSRFAQIRYVEIRGNVVMSGATLRTQFWARRCAAGRR